MEENLKTTDDLLEDVVNANLQDLLINQFDDEKQKKEVFDDTMKAVDRLTKMKEISSSEDNCAEETEFPSCADKTPEIKNTRKE